MKQFLFLLLLSIGVSAICQNIKDCECITLKETKDYKKHEHCIKAMSHHILNQPMVGFDKKTDTYHKLVYSWLEGTPDHIFTINKEMMDLFKDDNQPLFNIYLSCLANSTIQKEAGDYKSALGLLVEYIKNPDNKVKHSRKIKRFLKNWEKGKIKRYLAEN